MSLQNDLELLHLRESYMKNSNHSNMLSCVNSNSSTLSEDLGHDEDQHNDSPLHSVLKQWFGGNSTTSKEEGETRKETEGKERSVGSTTLPPLIHFSLGCAVERPGRIRRRSNSRVPTGISDEKATSAPDPDDLELTGFEIARPVLLVYHALSTSCNYLVPPRISGLYRISSPSASAETLAPIEHKDKDKNEMQEGVCAQTPTITGLPGAFRPVSNALMAKVHFLALPQRIMKSIYPTTMCP
ncbi:hypothetical protein [Absidia glauca]|uniref:Uncharacterized protein n=1 Tax=Absidia glauca TaxID=4829 RepID=A0A168KR19_ABSGL|nr:hypothetical protein [Absidia glauca]